MRIRPLFLIVLLCCVAALAAVYQPWHQPAAPYTGPPPDSRVVAAHTALGFDLLHKLASKPGENVFISPSSIATALEMTYNGASGQTATEMAKTLHLTGFRLAALNQSNEALRLGPVGVDPNVQIAAANSLWAQDGYSLLPAFMDRNKRFYGAEVTNLTFGPDAPARINCWVRDHTNGKIDKIVGEFDPAPRLVLVNAVYFHGRWKDPFVQTATVVRPFTLLSGAKPQCPLMTRSGSYKYLKGEGFQAIRLPYGSDRFAMYVLLPDAIDGLPTLLRRLNRKEWSAWLGQMQPSEGSISLPRFKVKYGKELSKPLIALGMASAFGDADFSGMTGHKGLFISYVEHKAYVDVDEAGTEAAAATAIGMADSSAGAPTPKPFEMVVDHPFLCAIRDDKTGEILFLGAIYNPTQN